jgi:hypothetical protein
MWWIDIGLVVIPFYMSQDHESNFYLGESQCGVRAERIRIEEVINQRFTEDCHTMSHVEFIPNSGASVTFCHVDMVWGLPDEHKTDEQQSDGNYHEW